MAQSPTKRQRISFDNDRNDLHSPSTSDHQLPCSPPVLDAYNDPYADRRRRRIHEEAETKFADSKAIAQYEIQMAIQKISKFFNLQ